MLSPVKSGSSEQFCLQSTIHKPTDTFAFFDYIVEVILETFQILAGIQILTPTLESNSDLAILFEGDEVDSGRSDLHDVSLFDCGALCPLHLSGNLKVSYFNSGGNYSPYDTLRPENS